jgi:hypothetical protein
VNPSEPDRDEERDAALIDRLYGDDAGEDLGELRSVRALIARVREEAPVAEPSPAISATLLQAARARAPKQGLWARFVAWMSPVTSHPALAAAATLVVVAGAAALWMRGGGEVAEPTRGVPEVRREMQEQRKADPDVDRFETDGVVQPPLEPAKEEAPAPAVVAPEKPTRKVPPRDKGGSAKDEKLEREEKVLESKNADKKKVDPVATVTGKVDGKVGGGLAGGESVTAQDQAPPPPPAPEPVTPADDADEEALEVSGTAQTQEGARSSKDEALAVTRKARAEAAKNNCTNTTAYGTEVLNLDRAVYDKDFVKDRFIDACLRRARSKKSPTTSGQ